MSSSSTAQVLMRKGKRGAAAYIHADCANGSPQHLGSFLDVLLNPSKAIDEWETIDWCRWLIAGGRTPDEFAAIVRGYDNHAKCGLVWIPHVVAYRCRTCGISPCMSICRDCFRRGDHSTHDFNMFLSQAGGACDCGDTSVMKEDGFCSNHGINNCANKSSAPADLMCVAEAMMPRVILRLLQHFRENSWGVQSNSDTYRITVQDCEGYVSMLMEFNNMGELMRKAMTKALINPQMYRNLVEPPFAETEYGFYMAESRKMYEEAVKSFPSQEPPDEFRYLPALGERLVHTTLLEEFIFWTFKYEFPQNVVCFLLNMLPDQDYKEHLTRTFVMHYARIPLVLEASADPDTLSNRVVHMSVQLFSNEALALRMVQQLHLLHVMVVSLKLMMGKILIQNTLHGKDNFHYVIDCARRVMKEHCYWPLVSDFNNVLSHRSVALVFLQDDTLIELWFEFLSMLQGMNVNIRELGGHVEFEPSSYYAAFSCELEAAAYPMWSVIGHLTDPEHAPLAKRMVSYCLSYLLDWLDQVNYTRPYMERSETMHASFHFPLHRYLAAFLCQAVKSLGVSPSELLPPQDLLSLLMMHPLRVQSLFYEILSGIWVRNGLQIKGQAMTYIQANFCNSMVDMDIYFLQVCAAHLPKDQFVNTCIDTFGVRDWLSLAPMSPTQEQEQDAMVEGLLTFLAILVSSRTNLGNDELTQSRLEISTLLATGDKTHSQLLELMPERSGNAHTRNFETVLKELSSYRPPPKGSENLEQGLFVPKPEVWEKHYDPLHVLQRAVHRRDFQNSMERFSAYVSSKRCETNQSSRDAATAGLWAPLRRAYAPPAPHGDPRGLCDAAPLHAALLAVLHRAVYRTRAQPAPTVPAATPPPPASTASRSAPPDHVVALAVFLLEVAVDRAEEAAQETSPLCQYSNSGVTQGAPLLSAFTCDNIRDNARTLVGVAALPAHKQTTPPETRRAPPANRFRNPQHAPYPDSDNDTEWEGSDSESGTSGSAATAATVPVGRLTAPATVSTALVVPQSTTAATRAEAWHFVRRRRRQRLANANPVGAPEVTAPTVINTADDYTMQEEDDDIDETFQLALPGIEQVSTDMVVALQGEMSLVSSTQDDISSVSSNEDQYGIRGLPAPSESPSPSPSPAGACVPFAYTPSAPYASTHDAMALVTPISEQATTIKMRPVEGPSSEGNTIQINESIISLLLKLHSQMSGSLDSFSLDDDMDVDFPLRQENATTERVGCDKSESNSSQATASSSKINDDDNKDDHTNRKSMVHDSRIGNGAACVGRLLRRLCTLDTQCAATVSEVRRKLWPHQREKQAEQRAREQHEKEERAKRAKERQQRLMQDFARRQTQFMQTAMESEECAGMDWHEEEEQVLEKEYDCVICNTTSPSTEANPIGLVVLLQSTSVVGHRRLASAQQHNITSVGGWDGVSPTASTSTNDSGGALPLSDAERQPAPNIHSLAADHSHRVDEMDQHFDADSWLLAVNIGWEGGVHVQSCGHHLHLHCLQAYLRSLTNPQRPHNLHTDRGEFLCPVCRQLANSVLPLSPALGRSMPSTSLSSRGGGMEQLCDDIYDMLSNCRQPSSSSKLSEAMGKAMEDMTNATQLKPKGPRANGQPSPKRLFSFVSSIARTNLEAELVQRGGSLVRCVPRYRPRRDCAVPLLHVLSLHARVLASSWPAVGERWRALCGRPAPPPSLAGPSAPLVPAPSTAVSRPVPQLLLDPLAQLLHCLLLVPLQLDISYFTCMVRVLYNLTYYQIVAQTAAALTAGGRARLASDAADGPVELRRAARLLLGAMAGSELFTEDGPPEDTMDEETAIDMDALEKQVQELCLPFLRIASLLKHHLYGQDLPDIQTSQVEFGRLVYYLDLITDGMEWHDLRAGTAVWSGGSAVARNWARRLGAAAARAQLAARRLLRTQHSHWAPPRLLRLPRDYDRLFTYYHERVCGQCGAVPKESSVCLLCGTVVCLKQQCCRQHDVCEAVQHSVDCGGGTGIFLVVTSTYIIVIRGRRACLWGSLYLDDYDEEDRDLKRGKPLYLSEDRFDLLESQWLAHRFDHTKRTWVWHRDSL